MVLLVAMLAWGWFERLEDQVVPKNFGVVEEGSLYRSGGMSPHQLREKIEEHGIRTVVDFGGYRWGSVEQRAVFNVLDDLGVEHHRLPLKGDGTGDPNMYVAALRLMTDESKRPMLVHCAAGAQRTGACFILYRTHVQGWEKERAIAESAVFKHDPEDNPRMLPYVEAWEDEIIEAFEDPDSGPIAYEPGAWMEEAGAEDDGAGDAAASGQ